MAEEFLQSDITGDTKRDLDISDPNDFGIIGGAIFSDSANIGSGTGNYNTFLALQDGNDAGLAEAAFNSDSSDPSNPEMKSQSTSILLANIPVVFRDGTAYYEFRIDLNEDNSDPNAQLSLDKFQIFLGTTDSVKTLTALNLLPKIYDMDTGEDVSVLLSEVSTGSGTDDYAILVPKSYFDTYFNDPGTPDDASPLNRYLYVYTELGAADTVAPNTWGDSGGFEEFNTQNAGTVQGFKFNDKDGDGTYEPGGQDGDTNTLPAQNEGGLEGFHFFADQQVYELQDDGQGKPVPVLIRNFNGLLDADEQTAVSDGNGNYQFYGLTLGTYRIYEYDPVTNLAGAPAGWIRTTAAYQTVTIDTAGEVGGAGPTGNREPLKDFTIDKSIVSVVDGVDANGNPSNAPSAKVDEAGDVITYSIAIHNTGEVALTGVVLSDYLEQTLTPLAGFTLGTLVKTGGNTDASFDPNETWTWSATYTVKQSDLDTNGGGDGLITNSASVTAYYGQTAITRGPDTVDTPMVLNPHMLLNKVITSVTDGVSANGAVNTSATGGVDESGDVIHYTITLTNDGNVTLTNVTLLDALEGDDLPNPLVFELGTTVAMPIESGGDAALNNNGNLDVGETFTWYAKYTVVGTDISTRGGDGFITNIGDATAKFGATTINVDAVTVNTPVYDPQIAVVKSIVSVENGAAQGAPGTADDAVDNAGDKINYQIVVTNTGNVGLTAVTVLDKLEDQSGPTGFTLNATPVESGSGTHGDGVFDAGEIWTYSASYVVQQGDFDSNGNAPFTPGLITNSASVTSQFGSRAINAGPSAVDTPMVFNPHMALNKVITSVTDGVNADGSVNTTSTGGVDEQGDVINYSITLFNDGNVALTDIVLSELFENQGLPLAGFTISAVPAKSLNGDADLDVGETWTWTASYTVKAADITGEGGSFTEGFLTNTADATAKFGETPVDVDPVTVNTPVFNPAFAVDKAVTSVTNGYLDGSTWIVNSIGDTINYTITVTNTGNVALTKDSIVDTLEATVGYPLSGPTGDNGVVGTLEVDEVWTFTAQHVVTAADFALSDDDIDNRIDAKFNFGNTQLTGSDSVETPIAKVDLEKGVATAVDGPYADADAPTGATVGVAQDMYFKITITNTGAVDLDNVVVWDISTAHGNALNYLYQNNDLTVFAGSLGATIDKADGDNVLSVGETWTIKYVEDFEYGQHINTGYVTNDQGATDNDAAHYVGKEVGPGVRTPGFWSNWQALWDGDLATKPKQQGTDGFADHDLLFVNADGGPTGPAAGTNNGYEFLTTYGGQKGLLIGDWNKDGSVDADGADNVAGTPDDEDVLFIKLGDAQTLINASSKQLEGKAGDGVMMLGRDVVATWLNYLAGNPIDQPGVGDDGYSPKHYIQDAVNWLQTFGDANNTTAAGPGNGYTYDPAEAFDTYSPSHAVIKTSTAYWSGNIVDGTHSAAEMHGELDFYNNTGAIHDEALLVHQYANPGG